MDGMERFLSSGFNVGQLREELKAFEDSDPVVMVCDYGDRHNTQQALTVVDVEHRHVEELEDSGYSISGVAIKDEDESDGGEKPLMVLKFT